MDGWMEGGAKLTTMQKPTAHAMPISVETKRDTQNPIMEAMKSKRLVFQ